MRRKEKEVGVGVLQEQVRLLQKENMELKSLRVAPESVRPKSDSGHSSNLNDWFED
jgi:hypothetical protein